MGPTDFVAGGDGPKSDKVKEIEGAVAAFDQSKKEVKTQVGGQTHKCISMKRVSKEWVVVDHEQNHVGFMRADSLAIVEKIKFSVEGYLLVSYGFQYKGKEFIFLSFSSGEIILIDGISLNLLSQMSFEDNQQVKSMLAFNQGEYILMASSEGTLFVTTGLENNSIKL